MAESFASRSAGPLGNVRQALDEAGAVKVFAVFHPDEPLPTTSREWGRLYARIMATAAARGATEVEIVRSALVERGKCYVVKGGDGWCPNALGSRGPGATEVPATPASGPSPDGPSPTTRGSSGAA